MHFEGNPDYKMVKMVRTIRLLCKVGSRQLKNNNNYNGERMHAWIDLPKLTTLEGGDHVFQYIEKVVLEGMNWMIVTVTVTMQIRNIICRYWTFYKMWIRINEFSITSNNISKKYVERWISKWIGWWIDALELERCLREYEMGMKWTWSFGIWISFL